MTLVAVLKLRDRVHLACDCMLSAPGPMHRADRLPFAGEIKGSTSTNPEYNVSGVARKCVLIDDRKIILWSGDAIIASSIIKNVLNKIANPGTPYALRIRESGDTTNPGTPYALSGARQARPYPKSLGSATVGHADGAAVRRPARGHLPERPPAGARVAVFYLRCPHGPPELRANHGFPRHRLAAIERHLAADLPALCSAWGTIHGHS
jgi:hypothetical protein